MRISTPCPRMSIRWTAVLLLALGASVSATEVPDRIQPFTFTENGLYIEYVDFGQVPPASFHQRFIVLSNTSSYELKNVVLQISGHYKASNCMQVFLPGTACNVILNYKAPPHAGWDMKWLNIEFTVLLADGAIQSDSQRLPVIGGTQPPAVQPE